MDHDRRAVLDSIQANIEAHGHHQYRVLGGEFPQFGYTIGLSPRLGFEILLAGAAWYSGEELSTIVNEVADALAIADYDRRDVAMTTFGAFTLRRAHSSWSQELALGVFDFYQRSDIAVRQLVPPAETCTIDVPDMTRAWDPAAEPVWRCLHEPWPLGLSSDSAAVTNLRALRGERITDGVRRAELSWELFVDADPDVPQSDVVVVPLSTLLFADSSLQPFTEVPVGGGLKRAAGGPWRPRG